MGTGVESQYGNGYRVRVTVIGFRRRLVYNSEGQMFAIRYNTIQDAILTCSEKLNLPHETNN